MDNKHFIEKPYLTPHDVAQMLMLSVASVRQWAAKGELDALVTPGGHRRFLYSEVLIVDNDIKLSKLMVTIIGMSKLDADTEQAFDAGMKVKEFNPDIILLDLMMPNMDGFSVCEQIKSNDKTKQIKILAMTGYPSPENVKRIISLGAERCFAKPISRIELIDEVTQCASQLNVKC